MIRSPTAHQTQLAAARVAAMDLAAAARVAAMVCAAAARSRLDRRTSRRSTAMPRVPRDGAASCARGQSARTVCATAPATASATRAFAGQVPEESNPRPLPAASMAVRVKAAATAASQRAESADSNPSSSRSAMPDGTESTARVVPAATVCRGESRTSSDYPLSECHAAVPRDSNRHLLLLRCSHRSSGTAAL